MKLNYLLNIVNLLVVWDFLRTFAPSFKSYIYMDNQKIYDKSNRVTEVRLTSFNKSYVKRLLKSKEDIYDRAQHGIDLLDYLCGKFKIANVYLVVKNKPRSCYGNAQVYGKYYPSKKVIVIYNLTAKTKKPISINSFYLTLLHEFVHHYDIEEMKLETSLHTAGFYKRISDLKRKLEE